MKKLTTNPKCQYLDRNNENIIHKGYIVGENASEYKIVLFHDDQDYNEGNPWYVEKDRIEMIEHTDEEIIHSAKSVLLEEIDADKFVRATYREPANISFRTELGHGDYRVKFEVSRKSGDIRGFHISDGEITHRNWL